MDKPSHKHWYLGIGLVIVGISILGVSAIDFKNETVRPHLSAQIFRSFLSQKKIQTVEGIFEKIHTDDFTNKQSFDYFTLRTDKDVFVIDTKKYPLLETTESGSKIQLQGIIKNNMITVVSFKVTEKPAPEQNPNTPGIGQRQSNDSSRKVAVILYNFRNNPEEKITPAAAKGNTFGPQKDSLNEWLKEASFGQHTIEGVLDPTGDVFGWYTIPYDLSTDQLDPAYNDYACITSTKSTWPDAAIEQAKLDGFIASNYHTIIYVFPMPCSTGNGVKWGKHIALFGGIVEYKGLAHEYGHVLGLGHAPAFECKNTTDVPIPEPSILIPGSCKTIEYGNPLTPMGPWNGRHYSAMEKQKLGWISPDHTTHIKTSAQNGIYQLYASDFNPGVSPIVQRLKISPQSYPLGSSFDLWYYTYDLEFRAGIGYDSETLPQILVYKNGALLDIHPETATFDDAGLKVNELYQIHGGMGRSEPVTIEFLSINNRLASAQIKITVPPSTLCAVPTLEIKNTTKERDFLLHPENGRTYEAYLKTNCPADTFIRHGSLSSWYLTNPIKILSGNSFKNSPVDGISISYDYIFTPNNPEGYYRLQEGENSLLLHRFTVRHESLEMSSTHTLRYHAPFVRLHNNIVGFPQFTSDEGSMLGDKIFSYTAGPSLFTPSFPVNPPTTNSIRESTGGF